MNFLQRLMYGRYGADQLGFALMGAYLVCYLLSAFTRIGLLSLLGLVFFALAVFRMFSRNISRRRAENDKFMEAVRPIIRRYNINKCRRQDKEHCYFKCPNCGQQLRVPKGKGRISITCRSCGASFEKKT